MQREGRLEARLAALLSYGTYLACALIAVGLFAGARLTELGVAVLIALPAVRVLVMLAWYLRTRDLRLAAICGAVLAILIAGAVLGAA